jgi:hypothetical protein
MNIIITIITEDMNIIITEAQDQKVRPLKEPPFLLWEENQDLTITLITEGMDLTEAQDVEVDDVMEIRILPYSKGPKGSPHDHLKP